MLKDMATRKDHHVMGTANHKSYQAQQFGRMWVQLREKRCMAIIKFERTDGFSGSKDHVHPVGMPLKPMWDKEWDEPWWFTKAP